MYDELVNKRIAVLNDDLQLIWEGEITKDNANEKLDMIMKDGNKYLYVGDEE